MNDDGCVAFVILGGILIGFGLALGLYIGSGFTEKDQQDLAVSRGHAIYIYDENGNAEFKWRECDKCIQKVHLNVSDSEK